MQGREDFSDSITYSSAGKQDPHHARTYDTDKVSGGLRHRQGERKRIASTAYLEAHRASL